MSDRIRRGHHQQVAGRISAWVPVGVRGASWHDHRAAGGHLDVTVARPHDERSFDDVPGLVVGVVNVQRRDEARRVVLAAGIGPLGEDDLRLRRGDEPAGQIRREPLVHRHSVEMKTLFSSVLCSSACIPSSLPTPDCL